MTEQAKRYHRSFIGLMEQCNDGEWRKNEDFDNITKYAEEIYKDYLETVEDVMLVAGELAQANKTIFMYRCMMWFMIVVGVVIEVIGVYYG